LLRLFGMLISPSQKRWLYHVALCIAVLHGKVDIYGLKLSYLACYKLSP
jgi:hypothetical protein